MQGLYNHWPISNAIVVARRVYIGLTPSQILLLYLCGWACGVNSYKQAV